MFDSSIKTNVLLCNVVTFKAYTIKTRFYTFERNNFHNLLSSLLEFWPISLGNTYLTWSELQIALLTRTFFDVPTHCLWVSDQGFVISSPKHWVVLKTSLTNASLCLGSIFPTKDFHPDQSCHANIKCLYTLKKKTTNPVCCWYRFSFI